MLQVTRHTLGDNQIVCSGCAACAASCPRNCISIEEDWEGFFQPVVVSNCCDDCGVCRDICPETNHAILKSTLVNDTSAFPIVWAAWNLDQAVRGQSSSGGVFSVLAEEVLNRGGAVVGAAFTENFAVCHVIVEKQHDMNMLRGSKYVQSRLDPDLYQQIRKILRTGRLILFSGTPCQVAGLRSLLKKTHDNLLCCDILCHGVPSPKLLKKYLNENFGNYQTNNVSFRDKKTGWKHYSVKIDFSNGRSYATHFFNDPYMKAFLNDLGLRNSCYSCQYATINRQGDITLADFWGVARKYPEYDADNKGTSLVLVNNCKGHYWLETCRAELFLGYADIDTAIAGNPVLSRPTGRPPERDTFFFDLDLLDLTALKQKYSLSPPSMYRRAVGSIKRKLNELVPRLARCSGGGDVMKGENTDSLRVAILTQPLHTNYGGLLQAYALTRVLKSFGCKPVVVNRLKKPEISLSKKFKNSAKKHLLCKYVDRISPILYCKPDYETFSRYTRDFIEKHVPKSKDIFSTEELELFCSGRFDAYIVGSDQVWRPRFSPCIFNYYLDFISNVQNIKRISYAASFGVDIWEYTDEETQFCKELIQKFDAISVREDSAVRLCKDKFKVNAEHVLDPTLLLSRDEYMNLVRNCKKSEGNLFAYILDTNCLKKDVVHKVSSTLGLKSFQVAAVPLSSQSLNNINKYIVPPVEDWILAFRDAKFIVTDSFHGCIFSIIFQKPFLAIGNSARGLTRFQSLLTMFGMGDRLISGNEEVWDEKIIAPINWHQVGNTLKKERFKSLSFLKDNLIGR